MPWFSRYDQAYDGNNMYRRNGTWQGQIDPYFGIRYPFTY